MPRHRLHLARDAYKFSCAHMTVFPDGSKERLHGHNFTVAVDLELANIEFENMVPFELVKAELRKLCQDWKEHLLLAARNPHLKILQDGEDEFEFLLCGKRYLLPRQDAILLPIDNICVEALAAHIADRLAEKLRPAIQPLGVCLEVTVEESPGQGASCQIGLA